MFAVYGETNRLKTKADHPNGEDFLMTKIAQLTWLFEGIPSSKGSWDIHIVDDGCPDGSGPACKQVYSLSPHATGPPYGYILSPLT